MDSLRMAIIGNAELVNEGIHRDGWHGPCHPLEYGASHSKIAGMDSQAWDMENFHEVQRKEVR